MAALPSDSFSRSPSNSWTEAPTDISAYVKAKAELNSRLRMYRKVDAKDDAQMVIETFFTHLPTPGKRNLVDDVLDCTTDDQIRQLVKRLDTGLLIPLKACRSKTPAPEPSPRFAYEDSVENLNAQDLKPATRSAQEKLREECLRRDGGRCVVTHILDGNEEPPRSGLSGPLQASHIIPFSVGTFQEDARRESSAIWTNIYRYFPDLRSRMHFTLERVNDHENCMMLYQTLHSNFGDFKVSFMETNVPNQYRLKKFYGYFSVLDLHMPKDDIFTLTCHDGRYPLPSPLLLQLQNAIAHILHATGRGEKAEEIQRRYDDTAVLATGGGTNVEELLSISSLKMLESPSKRRTSESPNPKPIRQIPPNTHGSMGQENERPRSGNPRRNSGFR